LSADSTARVAGELVDPHVRAGIDRAAGWLAGAGYAPSMRSRLSPVCCERPSLIGDDVARTTEIVNAMRMVIPVNILGLPSCAVPVGCDDGLPQGVQLIGRRFREDLLLDAAQAVEDRAPALTPIEPRHGASM
jgi:amidase